MNPQDIIQTDAARQAEELLRDVNDSVNQIRAGIIDDRKKMAGIEQRVDDSLSAVNKNLEDLHAETAQVEHSLDSLILEGADIGSEED